MSTVPPRPTLTPAAIENWYAAPLAVDGAIAEPLRRLPTTRVAVRGAVKALLVRRLLAPHELQALRGAGVGALELSQALVALGGLMPPAAMRAGPLGVMIRAMARVVRNMPDLARAADEHEMHRAIGTAVAHALAEDAFPHPGRGQDGDDPSFHLRKAVLELLTARTITGGTLDGIPPLERRHLAVRLEDRLPIMLAVVPPSRGETLARIVRVASAQLRLDPPVEAWALDAALAAPG